MKELKACPFCGSKDVFIERATLASCEVFCNSCGSHGPDCNPENEEDVTIEDEKELDPGTLAATRAWNKRANK